MRLVKYTNRADINSDIRRRYEAIVAIYGLLKKKRRAANTVDLMVEINRIISEYVQIEQAAEFLQKVKSRIAELDHWTDKQETKAAIDNLIRDTLWNGLPECYDELSISGYRQRIYEYVYTRYKDVA